MTDPDKPQFFTDEEYLSKFAKATKTQRKILQGTFYYTKVLNFIDTHCEKGEIYMEFLKKSCSETSEVMCDWCKENLTRVPRPYPNYEADSFHYLSAEHSTDLKRSVDDFQPCAQLRKLFQMGKITSSDEKGVESFSKTYIVPNELIKK